MGHGVDGRHTEPAKLDAETAREVAQTMQALATPSRLRLLAELREGPTSVGELADAVEMEESAVSHQLRILRHLGLVVGERNGRRVVYSLYDPHVALLLDEAVFHVEHASWVPSTGEGARRESRCDSRRAHDHHHGHDHHESRARARPRARSRPFARAGRPVDRSLARGGQGGPSACSILGRAAAAQLAIFVLSGSVALLADLIHNFGDALTAIPLGDRVLSPQRPRRTARRARASCSRSSSRPASRST